MKRYLKTVMTIVLLFFLSSCAVTLPYQLKDRKFKTDEGKGVLICSVKDVKYGLLKYPESSYYARRIDGLGKEHLIFSLNGLSVPKKEIKNGVNCNVLIFELPAGDYEIFAWQLFFNMGLIQYHQKPSDLFSIPFAIKPDSISYIGELAIEDYILRIVDESQRDIRIATEYEGSISKLDIFKPEMHCQSGCSNEIETKDDFFYVPLLIPVSK